MDKNDGNPKKIEFHNKVNENFREVHVDGAHGGVTPRGFINANFYSERFPIPKSNILEFDEEANKFINSGIGEGSKEGIVRHYEFGVYMDLKTAKEFYKFLGGKINELETIIKNEHNSK